MKTGVRAIIFRGDQFLVMDRHNAGQHYYALIGGTVDPGETNEEALLREINEETGLVVTDYRHVFTEHAGEPYGTQHVYLCQDPGGDVALRPDAGEVKLNQEGSNTYRPIWVLTKDLADSPLMSPKIKQAILYAVKNTFPNQPQEL